jgi:hypothetical protein
LDLTTIDVERLGSEALREISTVSAKTRDLSTISPPSRWTVAGKGRAMLGLALRAATLCIWIYLMAARGGFRLASTRDDRDETAEPRSSPAVSAVIPARDEAEVIGRRHTQERYETSSLA